MILLSKKSRKIVCIVTFLYTLLVLYFMFLAFGRTDHATNYGYAFNFIPELVPLPFPRLSFFWLYSFGNIAAFIPFGILFPLLFRIHFKKFIFSFIIVILILELLQSFTFLGFFDVDDVISNTLGATIGYIGQKIAFTPKFNFRKGVAAVVAMMLLLISIIGISEGISFALKKTKGPLQPLSQIEEVNHLPVITAHLPSFKVGETPIKPKLNLYDNKDKETTEYIYQLRNKHDMTLYANYAIPNDKELRGQVSIWGDGQLFSIAEAEHIDSYVEIQLGNIDQLKIVVSGNAVVWDAAITENKHWWQ